MRVSDLHLLTPNQAAHLTLELVTRLKKYSVKDLGVSDATEADKNNALYLLYKGIHNMDNPDFDGNGVCRNFASTVKAVFDSIKANQTRYNYLQNTYCFYEQGFREDYDPAFSSNSADPNVTNINKLAESRGGHAWNTFATFSETGVKQTTVDSTWSNFDYQSDKSINLDYTLQRMERDVFRILTRTDNSINPNEAARFYLSLMESIPTEYKVTMDDEWKTRVRAIPLYRSLLAEAQTKYPGLASKEYDDFTLHRYAKLVEQRAASNIIDKYLSRLTRGLTGKGGKLEPKVSSQIVRQIAENKKQISFHDIRALAEFPLEDQEQQVATIAKKYIQSWQERMSMHSNPSLNDIVFANPLLQKAIYTASNSRIQERLRKEYPKLFQ